jgi:spoIIIJ-associated protein
MKIDTYLTNLAQHLGLEEDTFEIKVEDLDDGVNVNLQIPEEEIGLFVGYKAEVINSIQRMLRIVFSKDYDDKRISLNINDYRENRLSQLKEKVEEICKKLGEDGGEYVFPPLSSFERFNIHSLISEEGVFDDFESFSEGEGLDRRLIIKKKS